MLMNKDNGPGEQAGRGHDRAPWPGATVIIPPHPPTPVCLSVNKAFYEDEMGLWPCLPSRARSSWIAICGGPFPIPIPSILHPV